MTVDGLADDSALRRKYQTQACVEYDRNNESEEPVEGVQVGQSFSDRKSRDGVGEAGQKRNDGDQESDRRAPVDASVVPVPSAGVV